MTKKLLLVLLVFSIALVVFFVFIANFSEKVTQYSCSGTYKTKNQTEETGEVFLKVAKYRWWVSLWNETSEGTVLAEYRKPELKQLKQDFYVEYYEVFRIEQEQLNIEKVELGVNDKGKPSLYFRPSGTFSLLSNSVTLSSTYGLFDGKCSKTK